MVKVYLLGSTFIQKNTPEAIVKRAAKLFRLAALFLIDYNFTLKVNRIMERK